jgi:crotonobetainyl-CoA:carnitine CoA-transferase CaiB-like acyl-CoA transferase
LQKQKEITSKNAMVDRAMDLGALANLKVLDFTHVFAGPFCTRMLADMGADVVHVESLARDTGDSYRGVYANRNKRSISLDLKNAAGHAVAAELAKRADVIVENFSATVMQRLKLDYESVQPGNPGLVFISLSGYGHTGPRSSWTSMNMNLQAFTGLMLTTGSEGDPPTSISNSWNDYIGGLHGVIAIMQALNDRILSGRGRHIDLSQFESSVATIGALLMAATASGLPPKRTGNRSSSYAPQGVYPCAGVDEWCAVVVETDAQWRALANVLGEPSLLQDERFTTTVDRLRNQDVLDALIATWTRVRSHAEVERLLHAGNIPAERMRRVEDVVRSSDSGAVYRAVPGGGAQPVLTATLPFRFSANEIEDVGPPCKLGEHSSDVLRDWLGMDDAAIAALDGQRAFA